MKQYVAGILIGVVLFIGGFFLWKSKTSIPLVEQEKIGASLFINAQNLEKEGDISGAKSLYKKIARSCPQSSWVEHALYRIFEISLTQKEKVVQAAQKYLRKFSAKRGSEVSLKTGDYLMSQRQDFKAAEKFYKYAITAATSKEFQSKAHQRLTEVYFRNGEFEKVVETNKSLLKSFTGEEGDFFRIMNVKSLWRLGKYKEAYDCAKSIVNPAQPFVKNEIIYWQSIVKFEPENPKALIGLGDAYYRLGFRENAVGFWKSAQKISPTDPDVKKRLNR